ncbi:MAG: bacillithiol biosynthesis deacetylase BshB1 [Gemmataceae bacterium]
MSVQKNSPSSQNATDSQVDYLVVASHPDDAEIGLGGTILRLKEKGHRVGVVDLTNGEPTPLGSPEIRARETAEATAKLGLDQRINLGLPNRSLENSLEARSRLAGVFRLWRPKVVFTHHWEDAHPDHVAASALTDAARFWAKLSKTDLPGDPWYPPRLLYYFSLHQRSLPKADLVLDISDQFDRKLEVLRCYHSQLIQGRTANPTLPLEDVETRAKAYGWTIQRKYGEPLASREGLGLASLDHLI